MLGRGNGDIVGDTPELPFFVLEEVNTAHAEYLADEGVAYERRHGHHSMSDRRGENTGTYRERCGCV